MSGKAELVQIFLPLADPERQNFGAAAFDRVKKELMDRFGGVTAFTHAPAEGLWEDHAGEAERDKIVVFEVMADVIDEDWWREYRRELERRFRQDEIVIRAVPIRLL